MEILVRIFLSLDLLFTAALFLFPTSEILEFALLDRTLFGKSRNVEMQRNLLRFIMVMVTAAVALAIPFFSVMTGLTGVFGSNLLGFLLPPSIYIKLKYSKGHWGKIKLGKLMRFKKKTWGLLAELVICSLIFLFGIAMLVLGIQARLHSSLFAIAFIFLFRFSFFSVLCHLFIARDFTGVRA